MVGFRSSDGSSVRLGAALVVMVVAIAVVFGGNAFGQQKQSSKMQQSSTKKPGSSSILPIKKEAEIRIQSIPEVVITEERNPNPVRPIHTPPSLITPPGDGSGGDAGFGGSGGSGTPNDNNDEPRVVKAVNCYCTETLTLSTYYDENALYGCTQPTVSAAKMVRKVRYQLFYDAELTLRSGQFTEDKNTICKTGQMVKFNLAVWHWVEQISPQCDVKLPFMHLRYPERESGTIDPRSGTFPNGPSWSKQCDQ